jgi:urease accessory protein
MRALFPDTEAGSEATAVLVNTAGGVCGGDRLQTAVSLTEASAATVTSQAAERFYRAIDRDARVDVALDVAGHAALHWAPQETILFDASRMKRRIRISLHSTARCLAAETLVFGRTAMGESVSTLDLRDDWQIWREGRLVWTDAMRIVGSPPTMLISPLGLAGNDAMTTLVAMADDLIPARDAIRERMEQASVVGGASIVNGILIARMVGDARGLRESLVELLKTLRPMLLGFPSDLPRVWSC